MGLPDVLEKSGETPEFGPGHSFCAVHLPNNRLEVGGRHVARGDDLGVVKSLVGYGVGSRERDGLYMVCECLTHLARFAYLQVRLAASDNSVNGKP